MMILENVFNESLRRYILLIRIDVIIPENDVEGISQSFENNSRWWHYSFESQRKG